MAKQSVLMSHLLFDRDTIIVGNAFVGGLGSLCGIGKDESHKKGPIFEFNFSWFKYNIVQIGA